MTDNIVIHVIAPVSIMVVGAIIGGVKYILKQVEKKAAAEREERNMRRDQIERDIALIKAENKRLQAILLGCDKPDCPAKKALAEYYSIKENTINIHIDE